ncbi:MAG: hypothetical protein K2Y21_11760 [Phycisphaerales bacterium]|nr:hypothetical protein [Phycisphaerales bacterium]
MTRIGQASAVALVALAGLVVVFGGSALKPAEVAAATPVDTHKVEPVVAEGDLPAVLTKRAESIARNLAQLGNAPKQPPPPPPPEVDPGTGEAAPPFVPPPVPDVAIAYLGMFGSSASPMALVSVDAKQQIVGSGQTLKHNGEEIKVVKIDRDKIEIERKSVSKTIELAARTTSSYTNLSGATPPPQANPGAHNTMPMNPGGRRPPLAETMRAPGLGRPRPTPDAAGLPPGSATDEGVPQR